MDRLKPWKTRPWNNRDESHTVWRCSTYGEDRGQGANKAFVSVHNLVGALRFGQDGTATLKDAITAYDESILERRANKVQVSKTQSFYTYDWANFVNSPAMVLGARPSHAA